MPKIVDVEARRAEVVDAVFRVVARDGLQGASLQNVADQAELNIGSLRHYFGSHQELMLFAMSAMVDRVIGRLEGRLAAAPDLDALSVDERRALAVEMLEQLLPLDDRRRLEVTVWLEFTVAARTRPALADLARKTAEGTRAMVGRVVARYAESARARRTLDVAVATDQLCALIDGLSLQAILQPSQVTAAGCRAALHAQLADLER